VQALRAAPRLGTGWPRWRWTRCVLAREIFLDVHLTGEIVRGVVREEFGWVRVHRHGRRERHSWSALCSRLAAVLPFRDPVATPSLGAIRALFISVRNHARTLLCEHTCVRGIRAARCLGREGSVASVFLGAAGPVPAGREGCPGCVLPSRTAIQSLSLSRSLALSLSRSRALSRALSLIPWS